MKRGSLVQAVLISGVCALLAAKFPSLADADAPAFSWIGSLVGAAIALFAIFVGSFVSSVNRDYEPPGTRRELFLLRAAILCLCVAVTSFTAYLYFPLLLFKVTMGTGVVAGVASIFLGLIAKVVPPGGRDV
ncbi:MAG: hypothetical protein KF796_07380 [Ramlibacter sp.]|nr:hypothetical protein [Ramlibacter sp.]